MKRLDQSKTKIQKAMVEKEPAITLSHGTPLSSVTNHHKSLTAKIPKIRQNISLKVTHVRGWFYLHTLSLFFQSGIMT